MNENDRRARTALPRSGEKAIHDIFTAFVGGMHGDNSFSHILLGRETRIAADKKLAFSSQSDSSRAI